MAPFVQAEVAQRFPFFNKALSSEPGQKLRSKEQKPVSRPQPDVAVSAENFNGC